MSDSHCSDSRCVEMLAFVDVLKAVQVAGLGEKDLKGLLGSVRRVQAGVDALIWRVGAEADRLAAQGHSAPAEELLASGGQVRTSTARKDAARSRTIAEMPGLGQAAASGQVSLDHVDSLARRLKPLTDDERERLDGERLIQKAATVPPDRFDRIVRNEVDRTRQDHGLKDAMQKRAGSEFNHWFDNKTGMGKFSGQLDPERYEALSNAIDQHTKTLANVEGREVGKNSNLAAAALVELVTNSHKRSSNLPHISVVVDYKTMSTGPHARSIRETGNGHSLPPETIERFSCDATLQRVATDHRGVPINVGRKYRTATTAQWTALRSVYSTCAWAGCGRALTWCQLHHITEWRNDGTTDLDNLVPLCGTHHHRVHEGQWSIKLKPDDRRLQIYKPSGQLHTTTDPPNRLPTVDDLDSG